MGQDESNPSELEDVPSTLVTDELGSSRSPTPANEEKSPEPSNGDVASGGPEPRVVDIEALSRTSSGPPYSAFSHAMKQWIVIMTALASFISPTTATIYFAVLSSLAEDIGVSINLINLTITSYMVFQALAPMLFGEFGDTAGRRPAFILAFTIYIAANVGLALQHSYPALVVLRCLQSAGASGTIALGFAAVADIASTAERGRYMGIVGAGINIGPSFGPVIGGLLTQYLGWRSIFWFCAVFTGAWLIPYILCVPETCRNVVGNGSIPPQGWNMTLVDFIRSRRSSKPRAVVHRKKLKFPNPINTLRVIFEKEMGLILIYTSLLYVVFVDVAATLSTQFAMIYDFDALQIGLCFMPYGVGCLIANIASGFTLDWNYRRVARNIGFTISRRRGDDLSNFPIERARIQPIYPALVVGLVAVAGYGWTLQARASLAVPLVIQFIIGLCIPGSFCILNTLIVDLYPEAPGTATAANNVVRCLMGAAGTAVIESMITGMGQGWCFTFLALVLAALAPILWVVENRGQRWRKERAARKAAIAQ